MNLKPKSVLVTGAIIAFFAMLVRRQLGLRLMDTVSLHKVIAAGCVCAIVGCTLLLQGCESNKEPSPVPKTTAPGPSSSAFGHGAICWVSNRDKPAPGPVPGIDHASILVARWGEGMAYVVWTDMYQPSGGGGAASSYDPVRRIAYHGSFETGGKRAIEHKCTTTDGKTGSISVNGQALELAAGSLILASTADGKIRLKQLKRDTLQMQPKEETFRDLAKTDPEISAFFSRVAKPEEGQ